MGRHDAFRFDARLGIAVPVLEKAWEDYTEAEQEAILTEWEKQKGMIPDRIKTLEAEYMNKIEVMNQEENFERFCCLNDEICDLASTINDLNIWYQTEEQKSSERKHR
jgi:hypothetical protein